MEEKGRAWLRRPGNKPAPTATVRLELKPPSGRTRGRWHQPLSAITIHHSEPLASRHRMCIHMVHASPVPPASRRAEKGRRAGQLLRVVCAGQGGDAESPNLQAVALPAVLGEAQPTLVPGDYPAGRARDAGIRRDDRALWVFRPG